MSHGDKIEKMPENWDITSLSENNVISSIQNESKNIYGVQFHPEVVHTDQGQSMIKNFIFNICNV